MKAGLKGIPERVSPQKKYEKGQPKYFFTFILRLHKFRDDLKRLQNVLNEILFLMIKFVLNKINQTLRKIKCYITFCRVFELTGWDVCFILTLTFYLVPQRHQPKACIRNMWAELLQNTMKKNILEVPLGLSFHSIPS